MAERLFAVALATLAVVAFMVGMPADVRAQSIVAGSVEGAVTDDVGVPLRGVRVMLTEARSGLSRTVTSGGDGAFSFSFVVSGEYTLRAESLGQRPLLLRGLLVGPGETVRTQFQLQAEAPPVTRVDTVAWGADLGSAWPGLGRRVSETEARELPDRRFGLAPLAALSTQSDARGGFQGRPASSNTFFSEGEPFREARHPTGAAGLPGLPLPRAGVSGLDILQGMEDIEWLGDEGAVLPVRTRPISDASGGRVYALGSGGPLWSSELVDDAPSLSSFWGGGTVAIPLVPDTSTLVLAAEGGRFQTVQAASAADTLLGELLAEGEAAVGDGLRETRVLSGLARLDWSLGSGGLVTARAGGGYFERTLERAQTRGTGYGAEAPASGTDLFLSAVVANPLTDQFLLEVRGSMGHSSRDFEAGSTDPSAWVVGSRARVGVDPQYPGSFSRTDFGVSPVVHFQSGQHRAKGGLRADIASHSWEYRPGLNGAYAYGRADDLRAGRGAMTRTLGSAGTTDFSTLSLSAFGQYVWAPAPGFDVTTGVRYVRETLPASDVVLHPEWTLLSGVPNNFGPEYVEGVGARLHMRWDPARDNRTWVVGGLALDYGPVDPAGLADWVGLDGGTTVARGFGDVGTWPTQPGTGPDAVEGTRLAVMNPDLVPPRTLRASGAIVRQVGSGVSLGVTGTLRRTEDMLRRTDLNRLTLPLGDDQHARPVFGDLDIRGGVLGADPATNRRFGDFEFVWALNPDGWSEYLGATFFLDAQLASGAAFRAEYTYSETTDNLFGAAMGRPEATLVPNLGVTEWDEGISDFDQPHRFLLSATVPFGDLASLSGVYRYRSGDPFTAMVGTGLDANGDGSAENDPAFVLNDLGADIAGEWSCLNAARGTFAVRNGCRGDAVQRVDLRLSIGLGALPARLVFDALNVTDAVEGVRDGALLIVDPQGEVTRSGGTTTVPYTVNPHFGDYLIRTDAGRMLRIGFQFGGGR
jgi:hypothetical protein